MNHVTSKWHQSLRNGSCICQTSLAPTLTTHMPFTSSDHSASSHLGKQSAKKELASVMKKDLPKKKPLEKIKPLQDLVGIDMPLMPSSCHIHQISYGKMTPTTEIQPYLSDGLKLQRSDDPVKSIDSFPYCGVVIQRRAELHSSCIHNHPSQNLPRQHINKQSTPGDTDFEMDDISVDDRILNLFHEQASRVERNEADNSARAYGFSISKTCSTDCPQNCQSELDDSKALSWIYPGKTFDTTLKDHLYLESNTNAVCNQSAYQHTILAQARLPYHSIIDSLKKDSPNTPYRKSSFDKLEFCDQLRSEVQCLDNSYEELTSSIHNAQGHDLSLQYAEVDGVSLLNEPEEQKTFFGSLCYGENSQDSQACPHAVDYDSHSPFQGPFDSSNFKQELSNNKDTTWMETVPHNPKKSSVKEKSPSNVVCEKDVRSTYGIFSSTARRHDHAIFSSLKQENSFQQEDCVTETIVAPLSLFEQLRQENGGILEINDSSLPFSVSKALKKHITQSEEQNLYKVPRMFQVAHSGGAIRSNRISKKFNVGSIQAENALGITPEFPFYKDENEEQWTDLFNQKTQSDAYSDMNIPKKNFENMEDNSRRLEFHCFSTPSDISKTQESYSNFHSTDQAWNDPKSIQPHSKGYLAERFSFPAYKTAHMKLFDQNEDSLHAKLVSSPKELQTFQFEDFSSKGRKFYDCNEGPVIPIHMSVEHLHKARNSVRDLNENTECTDNMMRQDRSPASLKSFEDIASPLKRTYGQNYMTPDLLLTRQNGNEVCNDVPTASKVARPCFSKWKKYESDMDEKISTGSRLYHRGKML